MPWTYVRHRVADYNKWKEVYDQTAEFKRRYGWKRYQLFQVAGDRTDILVLEEFATVEQARAFLASDDLRMAMEHAGVIGPPEIRVLQGLESGMA